MNYNFIVDDILRVEQEKLYIEYKKENVRVRLLGFGFLVIFPIVCAMLKFGSSIPSVFFHHRWGEMGIGYFPSVCLTVVYFFFMEWYKKNYVSKLKKTLIPCGCDFLEKHPNGIDRSVSFYDDTIIIIDDGVRTTLNLSECKRVVFGKGLILVLLRDNVDMEPFCVVCEKGLGLHKMIRKQVKCTAFYLQ